MHRTTAWLVPLAAAFLALLAALTLAIVGTSQKQHLATQYKVAFLREGETCYGSMPAYFDIKTGKPLDCTSLGYGLVADFDFPGFTEADDTKIADLAKALGADELSPSDQTQLQSAVDKIAATKPEKSHYSGLWGTKLQLLGLAVFALGLITALILRLTLRTKLRLQAT